MKKSKIVVWMSVTALAVPALAQNVPAWGSEGLGKQEALPPVQMISSKRIPLDSKEAYGIRLANEWKKHPDRPRRGEDGTVRYLFGATLPTLVCTPLQVCSIRLQAGEVVNDVHAGDTIRWKITPATEGTGPATTTLIIVKPTDAGLVSNLIVTTDRRVYTVKLASTQQEWIPVLAFDYPDDLQREWAAYRAKQASAILPTGQNAGDLDFNYKTSGGNQSWKPVRVYSDGSKTYIQFASSNFGGEAPALVALGNDGGLFRKRSQELVNYRVIGDRYVVDKVLDRAALIVGVGSRQSKIEISHVGGRNR